jgi:hypothetical protein
MFPYLPEAGLANHVWEIGELVSLTERNLSRAD